MTHSTSARIRWGLLGTARVLRRFVPAVRGAARSELCAIASRDAARAAAAAANHHVPRSLPSYEALLDDPDIDAVYIALPNRMHAEWTVRSLDAGKHVLCEKPMALSAAEVDAIAEAAAKNARHVVEGFVHLHHPQARAIASELAAGSIGELVFARGGLTFPMADADNIRMNPSLGGGALWDLGCYPVSLLVALAGMPTEVSGFFVPAPTGVDATFAGVLRFAGGLVANVDCSFAAPFREHVELLGDRGTLIPYSPFRAGIDDHPAGYVVVRGHEPPRAVELAAPSPFASEVAAFEATVLDGAEPLVPLALSSDVARTLSGLHESARTRRAVHP